MAQPILDDEHTALESQVRECYGRCAYSHKTHERMADRRAKWLRRVKRIQLTLSAATTCGALAVIFAKDGTYYAWATAAVSLLSVALNTYMTDLAAGQYELPWERQVKVTDGTSCGFKAPTRMFKPVP